jgi:DNA polymerase V
MQLRVTEIYKPDVSTVLELRFFLSRVPAGFPSPADDYLDEFLDLNQKLIRDKSATFFARADGDSMEGYGIYSGDLLVVNRAVKPVSGMVVVASLNGELLVKCYMVLDGKAFLTSGNRKYPPISLGEGHELVIWGVVEHSIHSL